MKGVSTLSAGTAGKENMSQKRASKFWGDSPSKPEEPNYILPGLDAGDLAVLYGKYLAASKSAFKSAEMTDFIKTGWSLFRK